jgi:hypothetical protein
MQIERRQHPAGRNLPVPVCAGRIEPYARRRPEHDDGVLPVDDRDPPAGPVERRRLGDRHEPEIALRQPLPVEAERVTGVIRNLRDRAAENLAQTVPDIVRERHAPDASRAADPHRRPCLNGQLRTLRIYVIVW